MSGRRPAAEASASADEHARIFHEAQRAADTIFSHYQLSQLLATHDAPGAMAQAVLDELVHVCDAAGGALWLRRGPGAPIELVARAGAVDPPAAAPPGGGWLTAELEDVGLVGLVAAADRPIDAASRRFLSLVRHELAIALRGALLRETLDRERSELAAIIQGASDAIVLVDADRRVTRVNPAVERMLQRDARDLLGRACHEALACATDGGAPCDGRCPFERVLRTGDRLDGVERTIPGAAGAATSVVGSYAVTKAAADGRPQAVGILRDTTELARLAELRRGFLGSVSHELRTPLALIRGYVETLLELEPDAPTARGYLRRVEETTDRLGSLIDQILVATQQTADHLDLRREPIAISTIVDEAVADLRVAEPALRLEVAHDAGVAPVAGDRDRLRQVVDNLLANAAKYGDPQRPIRLRTLAEPGLAVLRVEDRGIGVPADERELVFEEFHRARNVRAGRAPGSGLGLAISRRLVEAHGGTIGFDPDPAAGTAVVVRLPSGAPTTPPAEAAVAVPVRPRP